MSYIERETLLKRIVSLEQLARKRVYDTPTNSPCYERYVAQMQDRQQMLSIIKACPTADVVEVVRCKDCKHYSLAMLKCCFPLDDKHSFDEYVPPIWQPNDYCSHGERREG